MSREKLVMELIEKGLTHRDINKQTGVSLGSISRIRNSYMSKKQPNIKKVISLFDIHYGEHINLKQVLEFIKDEQPDEIILGGDMLDLFTVSKYYKGNIEQGVYDARKEILAFKPFLESLKSISPNSKIVWIDGNHEFRIEENMKLNPDRRLLLDYIEIYGDLIDIYIPYKDSYKLGKLHFTHGEYHSANHSKKMVEAYGGNVVYGHMHELQSFTHKTRINEKAYVAKSRPCLSTLNPDYKNREANGWVNGFGITYFLPNGDFCDYNIIINDGKFIYGGKLYG